MNKELITQVVSFIESQGEQNWRDYFTEDGVEIDRNAVILAALGEDLIHDDWLVDSLEQHPVVIRAFQAMQTEVEEQAEAAMEYQQARSRGIFGMLRYHGMSVGEFV